MSESLLSKPGTVNVKILGKDFQVACPEEEKHSLMTAAEHLDSNMRQIRETGKVIGHERIAIMAGLNITHELLALQNKTNDPEIARTIDRINKKVDSALNHAKQLEL